MMLTIFLLSPSLLPCLCLVEGPVNSMTVNSDSVAWPLWMSYECITCLDTWPLSDSFRNDFAPVVPVTQLWGRPWHTLNFTSHAVLVLTDTGHSSSHSSAPTVLPSRVASSHPALYGNLSSGFSDSVLCPFHPKHKIPAILWNHKQDHAALPSALEAPLYRPQHYRCWPKWRWFRLLCFESRFGSMV